MYTVYQRGCHGRDCVVHVIVYIIYIHLSMQSVSMTNKSSEFDSNPCLISKLDTIVLCDSLSVTGGKSEVKFVTTVSSNNKTDVHNILKYC